MAKGVVIPRPPKGLGPAGRDLHKRIWADLGPDMELDAREREVLRLACLQVDVVAELESAVVRDGRIVAGSTGQARVHPAVGEARQAALAAGRLLGLLALVDDDGRPQTMAQKRARHAAQSRYLQRPAARG